MIDFVRNLGALVVVEAGGFFVPFLVLSFRLWSDSSQGRQICTLDDPLEPYNSPNLLYIV